MTNEEVRAILTALKGRYTVPYVQEAIDLAIAALTPPNEWVTLKNVVEILADQLGECACDVNGNDEWLSPLCQYRDTCPNPPERLGCWMEFLRNRNRRPPEGEKNE